MTKISTSPNYKCRIDNLSPTGYNNNSSLIQIKKTKYFNRWLNKLKNNRTKSLIDLHIERMSMNNFGIIRPVGEGVIEKKINSGPGYRLYFCCQQKSLILLLYGGSKSSQQRDISLAKTLKKELKKQYEKD